MCIYVYKYRLSKKRKMRITELLEEEYSFFFGCITWLAGSYFTDQELNPGPRQ